MTKFEEEVNKYNIFERTVYLEGGPKKILIDHFKNWHSDEEFQAKEKEIKRLRKINHLYKKAKGNAERLAVDRGERLNQAQDELASLESQLQQQALPVVPECVADYISELKEKGHGIQFGLMCSTHNAAGEGNEKAIHWKDDNAEDFARAWLDGYQVEKPQLFYLKNKLTTSYLELDKTNDYFHHTMNPAPYYDMTRKSQFTQQEIDSMQTGSYEQIPVPVEDGE